MRSAKSRSRQEETGVEEGKRNERTSNKEGVSVGRGGAKKIKPRARWWKRSWPICFAVKRDIRRFLFE